MKRLALILAAMLASGLVLAENVTVATVNVWSGLTYGGVFTVDSYEDRATRAFRFDLLANGLADLQPHIVALQEANPLPAYAERIAARLDYDALPDVRQAGVRVGAVGLPANLREGEVLLAGRDLALTPVAGRQLSGPGAGNVAAFQLSPASQLVGARVQVEGRSVYLFTTRWTPSPQASRGRLVELVDRYQSDDLSGEELTRLMQGAVQGAQRRRQEARETVVAINELAGEEPVILMGSLYALPDSEEIAILREAGFVDVWDAVGRGSGYTYDATSNANIIAHDLATYPGEQARYDYIFLRGNGIVARSASVVFSRPTYGVHPSDHFGLVAELRIDP